MATVLGEELLYGKGPQILLRAGEPFVDLTPVVPDRASIEATVHRDKQPGRPEHSALDLGAQPMVDHKHDGFRCPAFLGSFRAHGIIARVRALGRWWRNKAVRATAASLVLLPMAGGVWQDLSASAERGAAARPGRIVGSSGRQLHLYCTGSGTPTVVFDSGLGESLADWQLVQPVVSQRTRACSYDRAGLGGSEAAQGPRDAVHMADELAAGLQADRLTGPFVFVGHSLGGLDVRVLAGHHPAQVAGLVLVDSASPEDRTALGPLVAQQEDSQFSPTDLCSRITVIDRLRRAVGWDRVFSSPPQSDPRLPPRWQRAQGEAQRRWLHGQSPACAEGYAEHSALAASGREAAQVHTLGAIPLVVVTRGLAETWPPPIPVHATEAAWQREQAALVHLSTTGRQLIADHSRHYIMLDQPDVVAAAVGDVLTELRASKAPSPVR